MSRDQYLTHVTLVTGASARSYWQGEPPPALEAGRQLLQRSLSTGIATLQQLGWPWYLMSERPSTKALLCTVWKAQTRMITFGVAAHSRHGAKLWRTLHAPPTVPLAAADCPPEPWLASRLESDCLYLGREHPEQLGDIRSIERVIAWAFLELIDEERNRESDSH